MPKFAPSTNEALPLGKRLVEDISLLRKYLKHAPGNFDSVFFELSEYDRLIRRYSGKPLKEARVFEIGYGARPYRMLALAAMGVEVWGIDAEAPLLEGKFREYLAIFRANGLERMMKSLFRHLLFDRKERAEFAYALARRGYAYRLRRNNLHFLVGDAAQYALARPQYDLIYSVQVFEHIKQESIEVLAAKMASWLNPGGIVLIQPDIWTGISGGHLPEWYPGTLSSSDPRRSEPWEHLRKRRFKANTTLNELTRQEYRDLFCVHFDILDEIERYPALGRQYLTPAICEELSAYSIEDLLYAHPLFVLRPRGRE